jgi:hypothetical protein
MKFNKWTLGLAAVGAVSMASAVRADEAKLVPLNTAVSSTVISGYVDVAAQYNPGDPSGKNGTVAPNEILGGTGTVDGFSLNDVVVSLDKPLDESPWASGYHVDLNWGNAALSPIAGSPVRQAYVTIRTPVGNGIDWKIGGFDGVTGYEGNTGYSNPNYTRSYGYQINPASELGIIGSYKIVDNVTAQLGMAQRGTTFALANQSSVGLSSKDYIATLALTAPDSWGWLKGSALNFGTVQGFDNGTVNNYSVNATLATPVTGLKVGLAFDAGQTLTESTGLLPGSDLSWYGYIYGVYVTYQATDKLAFNLRGEYVDASGAGRLQYGTWSGPVPNFEEITATVEYDLWANVVSRLEFRWDHAEHGVVFNDGSGTGAPSTENNFLLALNLVYKF